QHMPLNIYLWDNEWKYTEYDRKCPLLFVSMFNSARTPHELNFTGKVIDEYFRTDGQCIWVYALPELYHEAFTWFLRSRYNRMYTKSMIRWMYSSESITMLFSASGVINTIMAQETKKILLNDAERRKVYVDVINREYNTNLSEFDLEVLDTELMFC